MVKKWVNTLCGLALLLISIMAMLDYNNDGAITMRGTVLHGNSALFVIFVYLSLAIGCFLTLLRDYHPLKKLGYHPVTSDDIEVNEVFRRNFDKFSLTFYSWRDMRILGKSVDYAYRGLYLSINYEDEPPVQYKKIIDLFDKYERESQAIILFKENWFIDEKDLPRLIKKVHQQMGISNSNATKLLKRVIPERHHLTTKLDFGHHNEHGELRVFISKAIFFMPQIALFIFINFLCKTELGLLVGVKESLLVNNIVASVITCLMGLWHFYWANYWALDKGVSKETIIHTIKTEEVKVAFGAFFCLWGLISFVWNITL